MKPPKAPGRSDCRADPPRPPGAPAVTGSPPALRPPTVVTEPRGRKGIKKGENDKNNTIKLVVVPCSRVARAPGGLGGLHIPFGQSWGCSPRVGGREEQCKDPEELPDPQGKAAARPPRCRSPGWGSVQLIINSFFAIFFFCF